MFLMMKIDLTRINVQKIASLKDLFNSPINEVSFKLNSEEQLKKYLNFE